MPSFAPEVEQVDKQERHALTPHPSESSFTWGLAVTGLLRGAPHKSPSVGFPSVEHCDSQMHEPQVRKVFSKRQNLKMWPWCLENLPVNF